MNKTTHKKRMGQTLFLMLRASLFLGVMCVFAYLSAPLFDRGDYGWLVFASFGFMVSFRFLISDIREIL